MSVTHSRVGTSCHSLCLHQVALNIFWSQFRRHTCLWEIFAAQFRVQHHHNVVTSSINIVLCSQIVLCTSGVGTAAGQGAQWSTLPVPSIQQAVHLGLQWSAMRMITAVINALGGMEEISAVRMYTLRSDLDSSGTGQNMLFCARARVKFFWITGYSVAPSTEKYSYTCSFPRVGFSPPCLSIGWNAWPRFTILS